MIAWTAGGGPVSIDEARCQPRKRMMRLPASRFTLRRMMAALAALALLLGGARAFVRLRELSRRYTAIAQRHYEREWVHRDGAASFTRNSERVSGYAEDEERKLHGAAGDEGPGRRALAWAKIHRADARRYRAIASAATKAARYHAALVAKYRRAARFPWLPVDPDPPEPE
jgi:hypothetical protein